MTAAWSVLGVDLDVADEPTDGSRVQAIAQQRWVETVAEGLTGCILQQAGKDPRRHELHLIVTDAVLSDLQDGYDLQTPDAPSSFVCPRPGFTSGVNVICTEFEALWTDQVRGTVWWVVRLLLVEFAPGSFSVPGPPPS